MNLSRNSLKTLKTKQELSKSSLAKTKQRCQEPKAVSIWGHPGHPQTGSYLDGTTTAGAFESLLIGSGVTLDGVAIDATVFADNFGVNGAGALVLTTAVPEPTSAVLLGLVGIGMVVRRRK